MAFALLIYFAFFLVLAFAWPTWRVWRRDGVNAFVLPRDDSAEGVVGRYFRFALVVMAVTLTALSLGLDPSMVGTIRWLEIPALQLGGWFLLGVSLVWIMVAQAQMGASWRVGIDSGNPCPLVRRGVFSVSRNPIFLGMRASLVGIVLVLPNAVTLAVTVLSEAMMQLQVRLEEAHLGARHPNEYDAYRSQVRRWV